MRHISDIKESISGALSNSNSRYFERVHSALTLTALVSVVSFVFEHVTPLVLPTFFVVIQWLTTVIFTLEYGARVWTALTKRAYVLSPLGLIDLISILPTYLGLGDFTLLKAIRALRVMRFFRMLGIASTHRYFRKRNKR